MNTALLVLVLSAAALQTADEIYRKDYAEATEIRGIADPIQQADRCLAFLTNRKDSKVISAIATSFTEALNKLTQAKNFTKVLELADRWLAIRPEDRGPLLFALNASQESGNWQKVAEIGEKAYAASPENSVAYSLAIAYAQLKNGPKFLQYGDIAAKNIPMDQSWSIAYELVTHHAREKNLPKAAEYSELILKGFGSGAPAEMQPAQWQKMRTYLMETVGRNAYENRQYARAIELYNNVLKVEPKSDEAYFYIGETLRRQQKLDDAMMAFAKSAVLNGGHSGRARQLLEEIYKSQRATLVGLDQFLDLARKQLGVR
ncbi:MAG: tetratricopeptide repeat protein [Acidobacteria bacterium]|nr:tetratricopeptide repeat protein [Acidobacteriota bacterium]